MSERTTIGDTVYESIGSSSSNLLLKCNGTARIQWGGKLIDLIKNGKIASSDTSTPIFIISNESEIKSEGIYILNKDESSQFWIRKNGTSYNLTGTDLYISASNKQDITVEQQKQALENIGIYYNTYDELQTSGIQNGLVYVLENSNLYTVKDGIISEFEAKLKTVTVEQNEDNGEVINSSIKIVLSVSEEDYIVFSDKRITVNYPIYMKDSGQIGSENADTNKGYRLYIDGELSYLDVDDINLRKGSSLKDSVFSKGMIMMHSGQHPIPEGWAICDGNEYTYKGVTSKTPNLTNKFIKAVITPEEVMENLNPDLNEHNEFKITEEYLPNHSHPHQAHTHTFSGNGTDTASMSFYALTGASQKQAITAVTGGTSGYSGDSTSGETMSISDTVSITISGTTSETISTEETKTWENKSFKIEPNYYSLLFIMKL